MDPAVGHTGPEVRVARAFSRILIGLAVLLAAIFACGWAILLRHGDERARLGWHPGPGAGRAALVAEVEPDGPAAGKLQPGDAIRAVNGDPRVNLLSLEWLLYPLPPGTPYTLRIARGGTEMDVGLSVAFAAGPGWVWTAVTRMVVALVFCSTGLIVGLLRPQQRPARLYALATLLTAPVFFANPLLLDLLHSAVLSRTEALAVWLARVHSPFHGAIGFQFALEFPRGAATGRGWKLLAWLLYLWAGLICAFYNLGYFCLLFDPGLGVSLTFAHPVAWGAVLVLDSLLGPVLFAAIPAAIIHNARSEESPDQRRRLRWALFGATVGFAPALALFTLRFVDEVLLPGRRLLPPDLRRAAENIAYLFLLVAPVTLAYAMVRHRVFGVRIVVRRGLKHLLARNVLRAALITPAVLLVASVLLNPYRTVAEILFQHPIHLLLIAASASSLRYHSRLMRSIDRRFFREAYRREQVLTGLIEEIGRRDSLPELSRIVSERLDAALHPETIHLAYRSPDSDDFGVQYSSSGDSAAARLPEGGELVRLMESSAGAREIEPAREELSADECHWLERLRARLAVPMLTGAGRLVGLILLGEKRSEEPFTREDRQLLEALANQIAIVYENAALRRRVEEDERVRREVLDRLTREQVNVVKECPRCGACYDTTAENCQRDGASLTLTLPVDRTVAGKYRLERALARGGMGAVYQATDLRLNRQVAIKVMTARSFGDRAALRRFEREAQAAARLRHPNIVTVYDYGGLDAEGAYLVMELLQGETLRARIDEAGTIHPETAAEWFGQILDGMEAAHAAGVIHRDLKPENVFVTREAGERGAIKILDFGLAKIALDAEADPRSLTLPGAVLGTLSYMSPEQLAGQPIDPRTDVFSLGVLVVEALTGRHPFRGQTSTAVVAAILHQGFNLEGDSDEARALDRVLQRCLAKARADRFATMTELRVELIPAIRRCPPFPAVPRATWTQDTVVDKGTQ
ncbi:MAG TPA: protein kinase [Vicinamibacteria bacterium]